MQFELDDTLIDEIIFAMEDQHGDFYLDTKEKMVIDQYNEILEDDDDGDERYIGLPDWSANDGYRLMEKFTASLKNPLLRQQLTDALNRNKGVFRAFKDALSQHPQAEKQWYDFKDKKMKEEVINWYNALREEWGLEPIGEEPEDTEGLVLEDFVIHKKNTPDCTICIVAETEDGEEAGIINANRYSNGLLINKLFIQEKFRGMGLGKTLLAKLLKKAGNIPITVDVPVESNFFERSLLLEGFKPASQRFVRG